MACLQFADHARAWQTQQREQRRQARYTGRNARVFVSNRFLVPSTIEFSGQPQPPERHRTESVVPRKPCVAVVFATDAGAALFELPPKDYPNDGG